MGSKQKKDECDDKRCRHCQKHPGNRPRGLCRICYYSKTIRRKYRSLSKFGRRLRPDSLDGCVHGPPADCFRWTEQFFKLMQERALKQQPLYNPADPHPGLD